MGASNIIQAAFQGAQNRANAMATHKQETYNAAVADQNAGLSREAARRSRQEADRAEEAHRRVVREELGRAFTAAAQSGARGGGGVTGDRMLDQSATLAELDALNIRYGGELEANAHLTDAANYDFEAGLARKRAKAQLHAIRAGTAGSLLTSASGYGSSANVSAPNVRWGQAERYTKGRTSTKTSTYRAPPGYVKPRSSYRGPGSGVKT